MKVLNYLIIALLLTCIVEAKVDKKTIWTDKFAAAKTKAKNKKKDVLLNFTGSDWCGWCIRLDQEVFSKDEYKNIATGMFVHVKIDFPQNKALVSQKVVTQNKKLQKKYKVEGFPTIILTDHKGKPFAITGYISGGPTNYIAHLKEAIARRQKRDEAFAAAKKLKGNGKAEKLIEGLKLVGNKLAANYYQEVLDKIIKNNTNPSNEFIAIIIETQKEEEDQAALNKVSEIIYTFMDSSSTNIATPIAEIDKIIANEFKSKKMKSKALFFKANMLNQKGSKKAALLILNDLGADTKDMGKEQVLSLQVLRANILCETGKNKEGLALFKELIAKEENPDFKCYISIDMANCMADAGQQDLAIKTLKKLKKSTSKERVQKFIQMNLDKISSQKAKLK